MTEPLARFLIAEHLENRINRDKVINLVSQGVEYVGKVKELDGKVSILTSIIKEKDGIIELGDDKQELTEQEVKRLKRKAVGDWFKHNYEKIIIGAGGIGIGFGVGYLAK